MILTFFIFSLVLVYNNSVSLIDESKTISVKEKDGNYEVLGVNFSENKIIENYSHLLPHRYKALVLLKEEAKKALLELFK